MIAIIDYNAGNIASLVFALKRLGQECMVTNDPQVIRTADKVIFPGQGRAKPAMEELQRTGLDKLIPALTQPFLGICLGMQLLFEQSEEDDTPCLGMLPGIVKRFQTDQPVPQMGWNNGYYFVHSYYVNPAVRYTLYRHQYGEVWFASMVGRDNFFGVQFHPEKSGKLGQQLLKQFCDTGRIQPTQIIPALDLLNGKCVRLQQGDYSNVTQYSDDPLRVAQHFQDQGAVWLHVVDLDGAKVGKPINQSIILELVKKTNLRIEVGGGIRTIQTAQSYLDNGVDRVILGTTAVTRPTVLQVLLQKYGSDRIVVGLDIKSNNVVTDGWTMNSENSLKKTLGQLCGVQTVIVTDISKDGMLSGPNFNLAKTVQAAGFEVIVSGGASNQSDVDQAKQLGMSVIAGKALYESRINLKPVGFRKRIIACLDMANGRVVKGTQFQNLKEQGDPVELAKRYEEQGADEIVFLDIMATVENRDTLVQLVACVAEQLSIPFCVGGGVRTVEDIRTLLFAGADKVSIGSAVISNPALIKQASEQFGTQCIVISIDPKWNGSFWEIYVQGGRQTTGINAVEFAKQVEKLGAGELLVNSLDRDGTKQGYDLPLLAAITEVVTIPVIASSGVGNIQHIQEVFEKTNVSAALVAGVLHNGELTIQNIKSQL